MLYFAPPPPQLTSPVLNVSGHRLGSADIEAALGGHPAVAEAAVVGVPHEIKGEGIYCYVVLRAGITQSHAELRTSLVQRVRHAIGPIASPDHFHFAGDLPKTRSGKILRRLLRKIATGDQVLGDTTTLHDPAVVQALVASRVLVGRGSGA